MINNYFEDQYKPSHQVYKDYHSSNSIYLGDVNSAVDIDFIKLCNIKTVVTAAVGMDHISYDQSIKHIVYPVYDIKSQQISKYFLKFYTLVDQQIISGSVLVHCAAGVSRSATLVIAYIMKKLNLKFKNAIQYVRKARPTVCPNLGFEMQLKEFERYLDKCSKRQSYIKNNAPKTSQPNRNSRIHQSESRQLPEIGHLNMRKTQLKGRNLECNILPISLHTKQASRQSNRDEIYETRMLKATPVLKPKSQSFIQKKQIRRKNQIRNYVDPLQNIKISIITKLKLNQNRLVSQHIPQIKSSRKYPSSNLYF